MFISIFFSGSKDDDESDSDVSSSDSSTSGDSSAEDAAPAKKRKLFSGEL